MGALIQDFKFGLRMLARNPGFTAVAVLTLALGIGANTAVFSVVNGVLYKPLPFSEPDRLVMVHTVSGKNHEEMSFSYPDFLDLQESNRSLDSVAAFRGERFNLTGVGEAEYLPGQMVSASFFRALDVRPVLGRTFLPQEDRLGSSPVVMLSAELWKRKFGSDPGILGRSLQINDKPYTVVGVLPARLWFYGPYDLVSPLGQWDNATFRQRKMHPGIFVVGRLKAGTTIAQARADLSNVFRHLAEEYPETDAQQAVTVDSLKENAVGDMRRPLALLIGAVCFVLLIGCANVANLLLARSAARKRELAIRAALGAGRGRVIRQLLTESVLLALAGGALGLLVASWATALAFAAVPVHFREIVNVGMDRRVLIFALVCAVGTGILFGITPALRNSYLDIGESLKEGGRSAGSSHHGLRSGLVVGEVALSLVLLACAGLMVRTLLRLWSVDPGFDPHHVLIAGVGSPQAISSSAAKMRIFDRELMQELRHLPGVQRASVFDCCLPLAGNYQELGFQVEGSSSHAPVDRQGDALLTVASQGYFDVMRIEVLRGRGFTDRDDETSPPVVVIDEVTANELFRGQDPIGKRLNIDLLGRVEIVGVVRHVSYWGLDTDKNARVRYQIYFPYFQVPDQLMVASGGGATVLLRTGSDPLGVVGAVRQAVSKVSGKSPVSGVQTMEQIVSESIAQRRFMMLLLGVFAAVALALAAVGIYGVVSCSVTERTHEIGIRMAVGARRSDVLRLVVGQVARLLALGIGLGLLGAIAFTRLVASMLYGVRPADPLTFAGVTLVLTAVALLASYIPAQRATKLDPVVALRYE